MTVARERIKKAFDENAQHLDLSNLGLTSLPAELLDLTALTTLDLSNNLLPISERLNMTGQLVGCTITWLV